MHTCIPCFDAVADRITVQLATGAVEPVHRKTNSSAKLPLRRNLSNILVRMPTCPVEQRPSQPTVRVSAAATAPSNSWLPIPSSPIRPALSNGTHRALTNNKGLGRVKDPPNTADDNCMYLYWNIRVALRQLPVENGRHVIVVKRPDMSCHRFLHFPVDLPTFPTGG